MATTVYHRYLETEVLTAHPVKLVRLLYRGAIAATGSARRRLADGDVRGRAREINRAWAILQELAGSLDHSQGGELSRRLAGLYSYMQARLIEANAKQSERPLEEVERLLATLSEAWDAAEMQSAQEMEETALAAP